MNRPRYDVILDYFFAFVALFGVFIAGIILWLFATFGLAVAN
jgi:hypothetical protein